MSNHATFYHNTYCATQTSTTCCTTKCVIITRLMEVILIRSMYKYIAEQTFALSGAGVMVLQRLPHPDTGAKEP